MSYFLSAVTWETLVSTRTKEGKCYLQELDWVTSVIKVNRDLTVLLLVVAEDLAVMDFKGMK